MVHQHGPFRHHFILVPGFGAFDALGSIDYFYGVAPILLGQWTDRAQDAPPTLCVHSFPNEPTAGVATRARYLREWLSRRMSLGLIDRRDAIHLIGHSTGGLDIRYMLEELEHLRDARFEGVPARMLRDSIRSIQFLSTPHRGTNIARWVNTLHVPYKAVLTSLYEALRIIRQRGAHWTGRALRRLIPREQADDWIDAAIETLITCHRPEYTPYEAAVARTIYLDTLNWLLTMARDFAAIDDLDPLQSDRPGPAHRTEPELEAEAEKLTDQGIKVRSIATVARPLTSRKRLDLFTLLHDLIATDPPDRLTPRCTMPDFDTQEPRIVEAWENDGIVNTVSMDWPGIHQNLLIDADHGDIIGHYSDEAPDSESESAPLSFPRLLTVRRGATNSGPPWDRRYDLLVSAPGLEPERFARVWQEMRRFALSPQDADLHAGVTTGAAASSSS